MWQLKTTSHFALESMKRFIAFGSILSVVVVVVVKSTINETDRNVLRVFPFFDISEFDSDDKIFSMSGTHSHFKSHK